MPFATGNPRTYVANAAIPQGRFVKFVAVDGRSRVILSAAVTDDVVGVSLEAAAAAGDVIAVAMIDGVTTVEVEASAALAAGVFVDPGADGRAGPAATTDRICGQVESAVGAAGEFADVLLTRRGTTAA